MHAGYALIIDDDPAILDLMRVALRNAGYRVATAASFEQGVAALEHLRFDLVLTDAPAEVRVAAGRASQVRPLGRPHSPSLLGRRGAGQQWRHAP